jgi:multicomponent Na+:H+ antiporter subunit E
VVDLGKFAIGGGCLSRDLVVAVVLRLVLFGLLWLVLTEGRPGSGVVGLVFVVAATWLSLALLEPPGWRWRPLGLLRFVPYFAWNSLRGGVDVAWRAMHPQMPLKPGLIRYRLRLPTPAPRVFLAGVLSLLPGTLSARLEGSWLTVHALDLGQNLPDALAELEVRVADLFGLRLAGGMDD